MTSQTHWCDVLPKGSNNGSALCTLLRELGISAEEVVFFGDMENDLALMEVVPNSVAVANATPAVAAAARWHVGDVADEGVTVAIEEITRAVRADETPTFMRQDAPYASAEPAPEEEEEDADDDAMGETIRAIVEAKLGAEQD